MSFNEDDGSDRYQRTQVKPHHAGANPIRLKEDLI